MGPVAYILLILGIVLIRMVSMSPGIWYVSQGLLQGVILGAQKVSFLGGLPGIVLQANQGPWGLC